ncbi:DNA replication factor Dna2-domain-containing protein, partial [Gongronella butleri]
IDNTHHFLIQHPDVLISCTAVSDTFHCLRKSVLQQLTRQVHDFAEPLVVGDVIHRTLQHCLDIKDFAASTVRATFVTMIKLHHLGSLYVLDMEEATLLDHLVPYIDGIVTFGTRYVGKDPRRDAVITRDIGPSAAKKCDAVAIRNVIDIEEHLWSPAFGLKGMIDATVEMKLAPSNDIVTLPFELKTGKTNRLVTHRAQTILYTLMLSDRYGFNVEMGALYYTKVNALYLVPCLRNEIQSLLIARNDLATALRNQASSLPPMVRNIHKCQYCAVRDACLTQHKAVEQGDADSSGLGQWFDDHTDHLTDKGMKFFRHWMNLIALEEKDTEDIRKDIWAMPADIRERHGRCLKNMELQPHATETAVGGHWHTFTRSSVDRERRSILESSIMVGDPMVISSMDGDLHLGMGFVIAMDHASITISLSSPLRPQPRRAQGFDIEHCQTFVQWRQNPDAALVATLFRLDKDETSSGFQALKTNIVSLMAKQCGNETLDASHANLRRLIVDLEEPTFTLNDDSINAVLHTDPAILALNADQQNAVHQILTCRDYTMILGMPGTGKTTTIAEIIQVLVRQGKSVLLTAYTHNAVDNLLCKLLDKNVDFLRLGNPDKYADKFILVGDQYQLQPIVQDAHAIEGGYGESLFKILASQRPEAITYLKYQYRMNKDIMLASSELFYDAKLRCGNDTIANKRIQYPSFDAGIQSIHRLGDPCTNSTIPCWIKHILDPR